MNIFEYFKKNGIATVDTSFYRQIEKWKSWYVGNVRGFSSYRVYNGRGQYIRRQRKSLGMAKMVCEDIADLLLNEKVAFTLSDEKTHDYVVNVLDRNRFFKMGNEYQERKAACGTVAYVGYVENGVIDADGYLIDGDIGINYVSAENIFPTSWTNGKVTECIFAFPRTVGREKYIQLQNHHLVDGMYVIENTVLQQIDGSREGRELEPDDWKEIPAFENLAEIIYTESNKPQFVIDTLAITNNVDIDESNPMGVSIFANALDVLKVIDIVYDSYSNEYEIGKKRLFTAPEMLKNVDGTPAFDPDDTVFYMLPQEYSDKDGIEPIKEINPELRENAHSDAINRNLNYLSMKCGFGTDRYNFEGGAVKTATEVISENSDMYRRMKKHEQSLDAAIKELIRMIIRMGNAMGHQLNEDTEIIIDFDDSIIEDKQAERNMDRTDVAIGAMPLWEYRAKWYNEDEAKAKSMVDMEEVME